MVTTTAPVVCKSTDSLHIPTTPGSLGGTNQVCFAHRTDGKLCYYYVGNVRDALRVEQVEERLHPHCPAELIHGGTLP